MDDLEKELLNYDDMGTTIEKIKKPDININKFNINNFVKELENNLDNFDNTNEYKKTQPFNQNFKKNRENFTEKIVNFEEDENEDEEDKNEDEEDENEDENKSDDNSSEKKFKNIKNWNNTIYTFLVNIKEPLIIILLFILLNNNDLILLTHKIFFINNIKNQYISLIIRGVILAIIIYYLRNL
jgi:hypothetical protein